MFEVKNGSGGYDRTTIIENINFTIKEGEKVALLGRNGAGKTTLLKFIMKQLNLSIGTTLIEGKELGNNPTLRARNGIGYVPQGRFVFEKLTVKENIAVVSYANGYNADDAIDLAFDIFPILKDHQNRNAGSLSGGQQQIVAIARALAVKPKILLLDEPSEGIQPSIILDIANSLNEINKTQSMALLIAEQNLDFCMSVANRAIVMNNGSIVKQVSKKELLDDKLTIKELLGV